MNEKDAFTPVHPDVSRRGFTGVAAVAVGVAGVAGGTGAALAAATGTARAEGGGSRRGTTGGARVVGETWHDERTLELTVDSPALAATESVVLLVPDGWRRRGSGRRWPVVYLLPGGDGDPWRWLFQHGAEQVEELREVLVAIPGMPLFGFYTDWWNGGEGGPPRVETFHVREVMPLLEREYGADRRRVAIGDSQGGFGALAYAGRHPGIFRGVAAFSAGVHPLAHADVWLAGAAFAGIDGLRVWGDPVAQREVWTAHDPYYLAGHLKDIPVHLSCGDGTLGVLDPPDTEPDPFIPGTEEWVERLPDDVLSLTEAICGMESRALANRLIALGTPVTARFYPGTHAGDYLWRELRVAVPPLLAAL
ncbi:alpha/beta hydrolase [Streptomyces sp. 4N509B]|uniref:alpha/beta hydrolase n=1 Tax=Streptomyces sp. 4N509B TaxID=3457413 RepID=UPI003FD3E48D